jgi:hypothetical protein
MVPRIAKRGQSFKGAGLYYLHDKGAMTAERVEWTHTANLPTNDPEKAMKCMAWTAMHADDLKRESGASAAGRETTAGSVYSYSLSWHGEQSPDKAAMLSAALATLERLGLSEHQAVIVAHGDTQHPHAHIIVNLVHPETGRTESISHDKRKLSAWASEYERGEGKIYCTEREENARRRQEGQITKHQDERLPDAPSLTEIYRQCDTGKAFAAALAEAGYTIASGDKGRLVIVDGQGKIQNLVRQIDGAKKKDVEAKLSDIDLAAMPTANDEAARRKSAAKERAAPSPATVSHVAAVVPLPAPSDGGRPADREEQPQSPFVQYGLPATFEEYRRLKDGGQLDRNEASAAEEKTPPASPYAAYGLPPTFEEYRRLRDGKQRQEEPPPALKAHSLHVAAVGSVPNPSAEERHDTAVAVYGRLHAKSESVGNREMLREARRLDGAWKEIEGLIPTKVQNAT